VRRSTSPSACRPGVRLSDLDIGMNDDVPGAQVGRRLPAPTAKMLSKEEIRALPKFHRYLDGTTTASRTAPCRQ